MPGDDLTPGQVAELLAVDASTLRRWARAFKEHLSPQATGKRRRYSSADLAVLSRARGLLRAGKSPGEVAGLLATVPDQSISVPAVASVTLPALVADLAAAQEALRAALGQIGELRATQEEQGAQLAALQALVTAWQALPWWRRLFGRVASAPPPPPGPAARSLSHRV